MKKTRAFENKEHTARKRPETLRQKRQTAGKGLENENTEHSARKRLEHLETRSDRSKGTREFDYKEQTAQKD